MSIYEGGTGGKLRRQQFRRPSPYDRPPSAARGLRGLATAAGSGGGWLAKFVDPASRFLVGSASRIFSSVFRKELKRLPEAEGLDQNSRQHIHNMVDHAPIKSQIQEAINEHNQTKKFESNEISEIEQLLKQKKLTRAQIDYLTRLICSRTIECTEQISAHNNVGAHVSKAGFVVGNSSFNGKLSTSENVLNILHDVTASPAEIAKAYMSSKLSKTTSLAIGLQSQEEVQEGQNSSQDHLSIVPHSALRLSYDVPKPRGRTALYRMSRSPFFKAGQPANVKVDECSTPDNAAGSSSQRILGNTSKSNDRQLLKRGNTFLDDEYGSIGPIRRIRQKTSLILANNARAASQISSYSFPTDGMKDPTTSQQPQLSDELNYTDSGQQIAERGQLSEASRKERTNMKSATMDAQPSRLTGDMLNVQALSSMKNVNSSQFLNCDATGTSDLRNIRETPIVEGFQSEKIGTVLGEDNAPSKLYISGVKDVNQGAIISKIYTPSISCEENTKAVPSANLWKPAFQMTAPEDLIDLDDEEDALNVSFQPTVKMVKPEQMGKELKNFVSGISAPEQPLLSSSISMSICTSVPMAEINNKANDTSHDFERVDSFRFPVVAESSCILMPKEIASSKENLPSNSEETLTPVFKSVLSSDKIVQPEKSNLYIDRGKEEESLHKSSGIVSLPNISTSGNTGAFAFDAKISSSQINGLVPSFSSPTILPASTTTAVSSSATSLFPLDSKLKTSTTTFGAMSAPVLASLDAEGKNSSKSPFASFFSTTTQVASSFSNTGNGNTLTVSSPFPGLRTMPVDMNTNDIVCSSASAPTNGTHFSDFSSMQSTNFSGSFGAHLAQSASSNSLFSQSCTSQSNLSVATSVSSSSSLPMFGSSSSSSTFGPNILSSQEYTQMTFGSTIESAKPFGSTSAFSFSSVLSTSSSTSLPFSSGVDASCASSTFLFPSASTASNSLSVLPFSTGSSNSNPGFSFSVNSSSSNPAVKCFSQAPTGLFGGNSQASSSSISTPLFGSSPSTGFSFGLSSSAPSTSSFGFGSSSRTTFPFSSTAGAFISALQNNDQMNVEDTMTEDTNQAPLFPTFGQPSSTPSSNFMFGSAVQSSGTPAFQFGTQQNPPTVQNPNTYQVSGNLEFAAGGSFSLGSGGGDKSMRKTVKVRRDKIRRK